MGPRSVTAIVDRSGVTELPRLTSDPICTADRRGGILISFGPNRKPSGIHNPFGLRVGPRRRTESNGPSITRSLQPYPNSLVHLRATDRSRPGTRIRRRVLRIIPESAHVYKGVVLWSPEATGTQRDPLPSVSVDRSRRSNGAWIGSCLRAGTRPEGTWPRGPRRLHSNRVAGPYIRPSSQRKGDPRWVVTNENGTRTPNFVPSYARRGDGEMVRSNEVLCPTQSSEIHPWDRKEEHTTG